MFLRFRKKTKISELVEGTLAVVEGKVVAKDLLMAPGSKTKCVHYEVMIETFGTGSRARGRAMWIPEKFDQRFTGFFVEDESGKVWVADDIEELIVDGARQEAGIIGKSGRERYMGRVVCEGDQVRVRGMVAKGRKSDPADVPVLRANEKGKAEVLVKKHALD